MEIEDLFEKHKIRLTAMRQLIYEFLVKQDSAVSLTEVETALSPSDRTTLYRTLQAFEKHGLVHRIDDGSGVAKYALCPNDCNPNHHHDLHLHFRCKYCHKTVCLTDRKIPPINLPPGFQADDMDLVVKGVCDECQDI